MTTSPGSYRQGHAQVKFMTVLQPQRIQSMMIDSEHGVE